MCCDVYCWVKSFQIRGSIVNHFWVVSKLWHCNELELVLFSIELKIEMRTVYISRLMEWIFYNVNAEENSDRAKATFLKGLSELLCSEGGKSPHTPMLPVRKGGVTARPFMR